MSELQFMNCNRAIVEAALLSDCRFFTGYPLTPSTEALEQASHRMAEVGGVYLQGESEVSVINMLNGAAAAGFRCMTATSGAGLALMQEGLSHIAGICELPLVILNVSRGGAGFGNLSPSQADYYQATRGGGAGDYRCLVFGPETVQEAVDLTKLAFSLADKYRTPAIILSDQMLAETSEAVDLGEPRDDELPEKWWATTGCEGREPIYSGRPGEDYGPHAEYLSGNLTMNLIGLENKGRDADTLEAHAQRLWEKYRQIEANEARADTAYLDDAELVLVAFGTSARLVRPAIEAARAEGSKVGLIRPITLWPFPSAVVAEAAERAGGFLVVEMSMGQMAEDVRLAVNGRAPVELFATLGGNIPRPETIAPEIRRLLGSIGRA
ncbi:MAG: transketolase C-terminal domain-containing protein [Alphaproteobacteria bacterium]|jgi:2-oxoglutarate ferredoxin oxidoreductase subunit alpha|nr:transketolase C-terminal domain-containing protein [Alphaproteobacteria bacterium]